MTLSKTDNAAASGRAKCPICAAPTAPAYAPFCSKRCAEVDLHRWRSGGYAIPAVEDDSDGAPGEGLAPPDER